MELYRGTIVENSLEGKSILENLKIIKTSRVEDWVLHGVVIGRDQIDELSKYLKDVPWYMHFWQEGRDEIIVVFKNKIFKIKKSDKSTWADAIEYGESLGIPNEQLDFAIV
jgi:hypothetical protein